MSPSYVAKSEVELFSATWQTSVSRRVIIMHELTAKTKKEDVPTKPNVPTSPPPPGPSILRFAFSFQSIKNTSAKKKVLFQLINLFIIISPSMAMNMMRSESSLNIAAPPPSPTPSAPPSPIPRAAGSRSAANQILTEFLEKSLQIPELALPEPYNHRVPDEINLRSLVLGENYWLDRVMKSARDFGAFRIRCHGISAEELRALVRETERVFGILEERDTGYRRDMGRRSDNKEEIVWVRSGKERMDWAREYIGAELFRSFR